MTTESIRNIAVAGHGATGKTQLTESLLFAGGAIPKPELVDTGRTVCDFTEEEHSGGMSIHTSLTHVTWNDQKINILDTPGASDFVGEVVAAFRATESAAVVVAAKAGVQIETIKLWRRLERRNMPRFVIISKMDEERADFEQAVADLNEKFKRTFVPITIPIGNGTDFGGVVDLLAMKAYMAPGMGAAEKPTEIPAQMQNVVDEARAVLIASAAEGDEDLEMKYLEEETLSDEEIKHGLAAALRQNKVVPVLCTSSANGSGILSVLEFIAGTAPSPAGTEAPAIDDNGEETTVSVSAEAQPSAFVFKTSIDQFSGKLSLIKVITGSVSSDTDLVNAREQKKEKLTKVYTALGKKLDDAGDVVAGDIAILAKLPTAQTNDTLAAPGMPVRYQPLSLPQPVHSVAIEATARKDEDKLAQMLTRATDEDLTFIVRYNPETKETVASGMGEQHLNMILDRIKETQKIEVDTKVPKVAYRETITKPSDAEYTHKKQTGGHGQYGRVVIKVRPLERGLHYEFVNEIKGGAVSRGYIPGIEKGFHEAMESGVLAGYPVVDVGISLIDGKEHPVDSSEMAFKLAARGALNDAMQRANSTLLEPVMNLNVFIDEEYLGDVLADLSGRRGRVMGQDQLGGGIIEIKAQVPQAELLRYSIDLRSITSGTGGFEIEFSHYNPISGKIAEDVIKAAAAAEEE